MQAAIRFDRQYDVARLQAELNGVAHDAWHGLYWPEYFDGDWKAAPLVANEGASGAEALQQGEGPYRGTPLLDRCPYVAEILDSFRCRTKRVRFMRLPPGAVIHEHRDNAGGWCSGLVRLHLPIQTNEHVSFLLGGKRIEMREGELWYTNVMLPHAVRNEGDCDRVHLVMDLVVDDAVRALFPKETLRDRMATFAFRHRLRERSGRVLRPVWRYTGLRALYRLTGLPSFRKRYWVRHRSRARLRPRENAGVPAGTARSRPS